jgi:dipicolinate synthase subunit A
MTLEAMSSLELTKAALWQRLIIAVLGGDEREQEIARLAAESAGQVRAFGFPWPSMGISNVTLASSAAHALSGAHIALMPIPGIDAEGSLFAGEKIIPREPLLRQMAPGAHLILGRADAGLELAARAVGATIHEYEHDRELMLLRAPAIVEAVLRIIIEHTVITIHHARICVVGQGIIGAALTRTLVALGARVTVAARNAVQRASAYTLGAAPLPLDQLEPAISEFDAVISTVSAPIVTAALIDRMNARALLVDIAAPPGSCDLDHARKIGLKAIWARALGRRAPITVGRSQWAGISRIIDGILPGLMKHAS